MLTNFSFDILLFGGLIWMLTDLKAYDPYV